MSAREPGGTGGRSSAGSESDARNDWPRRLLAAASARTSVGRSQWGLAMLAELDQVAGHRDRWRFAIGSARTMTLPALRRRLGRMALATAAAGAIAIHLLLPGIGPAAAIVIPGALCLCAWAAVAPSATRAAPTLVGRASQVIALATIAACPVLAIRLLALYPGQAARAAMPSAASLMSLTIFAANVVTYVLLALRRPEPLGAWRYSGALGLAAALTTGGVFLLNQPAGGESDNPVVSSAVVATAIAAPLAAGALAAMLDRPGTGARQRVHSAAGEFLWGWLLTAPAVFAAVMLATSRSAVAAEAAEPGFILEAHQQGAGSVLAWVSRDDVGGAVVIFAVLSVTSMLSFLVIHALASGRLHQAGGMLPGGR